MTKITANKNNKNNRNVSHRFHLWCFICIIFVVQEDAEIFYFFHFCSWRRYRNIFIVIIFVARVATGFFFMRFSREIDLWIVSVWNEYDFSDSFPLIKTRSSVRLIIKRERVSGFSLGSSFNSLAAYCCDVRWVSGAPNSRLPWYQETLSSAGWRYTQKYVSESC